ncbi:Glutamate--cysteine ligase, divergent, of Alpha-and Beta-proteobacteria type [hydrothermal vent metagenome]|uniref:Glutamate--cysteine ligase, divergent, of Alpha-and Beta-proteobacteria type n=1 Tax=hydrothermal vent metagenome TaxID=652676 RepID=A0A3B0Z8Y8_9ZZZZ
MSVEHLHAVPHLTTVLNGPLLKLERHFLERQAQIESWLRGQWLQTPAPFYASVDLRNAGFKLAPVDTNLFPAGFNNLNPAFYPLCFHAVQSAIERLCPDAHRILLIPENHTRNTFYLESLSKLTEILSQAGLEVRVGTLAESGSELELPSGRILKIEPITRTGNKVGIKDFTPCAVLLNNDLSSGRPEILENLDQMVTPPLDLGWDKRLKSQHFSCYQEVATEFAEVAGIDPWLINPLFRHCGEIDFKNRNGGECLQENVGKLLYAIQLKYDEYGVDKKPFVIIKADSGTYGMSVMTVHDPDEIMALNRKQRVRMAASKGGQSVSKVIIQEGVYTFETWGEDQAVAEPVVYMIDHFVVGGFYRVHTGRGVNENLNAPGMHFEPLAFAESCSNPDNKKAPDAHPNRFYAYGLIARLALLAAAREIKQVSEANN